MAGADHQGSSLPEPLREVLESYCHVEWRHLAELADDVRTRRQKFSVDAFRAQLEELLAGEAVPYTELNDLLSEEFESSDEAKKWLSEVWGAAFEGRVPR